MDIAQMVAAITAGSDECAHARTARYLNVITGEYVRWCRDCLKEPVPASPWRDGR